MFTVLLTCLLGGLYHTYACIVELVLKQGICNIKVSRVWDEAASAYTNGCCDSLMYARVRLFPSMTVAIKYLSHIPLENQQYCLCNVLTHSAQANPGRHIPSQGDRGTCIE